MKQEKQSKGFRFNWKVDQLLILANNLPLDIVDWSIYELIKEYSTAKVCRKQKIGGIEFFNIHWTLVSDQMPILGLTTKRSVFNRLDKLIEAGLLQPMVDDRGFGKSWFKFGEKHEELLAFSDNRIGEALGNIEEFKNRYAARGNRKSENKSSQTKVETKLHTSCEQNFTLPVNKTSQNVETKVHTNNIKEDKEIIDTNIISTNNNVEFTNSTGGNNDFSGLENLFDHPSAGQKITPEDIADFEAQANSDYVEVLVEPEESGEKPKKPGGKESKKKEPSTEVKDVVAYLNTATGKDFKPDSFETERLINRIFKRGYTFEEIQMVIDLKTSEWLNDLRFDQFLRPATLFAESNFESYLQQVKRIQNGSINHAEKQRIGGLYTDGTGLKNAIAILNS